MSVSSTLVVLMIVVSFFSIVAAPHTRTRTRTLRTPSPSATFDDTRSSTTSESSHVSTTRSFASQTPSSTLTRETNELTSTITVSSSPSASPSRTLSRDRTPSPFSQTTTPTLSDSRTQSREGTVSPSGTPSEEMSLSFRSQSASWTKSFSKDGSPTSTPSPSDSFSKATMSNLASSSDTSSVSRQSLSPTAPRSATKTPSPSRTNSNDRSASATHSISSSLSNTSSLTREATFTNSPSASTDPSPSMPTPSANRTSSLTTLITPTKQTSSSSVTKDMSATLRSGTVSASRSGGTPSCSTSDDLSRTSTSSLTPRRGRMLSSTVVPSITRTPRLTASPSMSPETLSQESSQSRSATPTATLSLSPAARSATKSVGTPTDSSSIDGSASWSLAHSFTDSSSLQRGTKSVTPSGTLTSSPSGSSTHSQGSPSQSAPASGTRSPTPGETGTLTPNRATATVLPFLTHTSTFSASPGDSASRSSSSTLSTSGSLSRSQSTSVSRSISAPMSLTRSPSFSESEEVSASPTESDSMSPSVSMLTHTVNRFTRSNSASMSLTRDTSFTSTATADGASRTTSASSTLSFELPSSTKSATDSMGSATRVRSRRSLSPSSSTEPSMSRTASQTGTRATGTQVVTGSRTQTPTSSRTSSVSLSYSNSRDVTASPSASTSQSFSSTLSSSQDSSVTFDTATTSYELPSGTRTCTIKATSSRGPRTRSTNIAATKSVRTPTPSPTEDASPSRTGATQTKELSETPSGTSMWTFTVRSSSTTQTLTMTETVTKRRSSSRNPSSSKDSATISLSGPTVSSEPTSEATRTLTLGSHSKSPYSKTKTPNTRTSSGTATDSVVPNTPTFTLTDSEDDSATNTGHSLSRDTSATPTDTPSPTFTMTLSPSDSVSLTFSDTATQQQRSMSDSQSLSMELMSASDSFSRSKSNPSASRSSTEVATMSLVTGSPSLTDSREPTSTPSVSPTPEVSESRSATMSVSQTLSMSPTATFASETDAKSGSASATPSPSSESTLSTSGSTPPTSSESPTMTQTPTLSSSRDITTTASSSAVRTGSPLSASSSPSASASPSPDKHTLTPTPTEVVSVTFSRTPPPSASRRITPSQSSNGESSTVTHRLTAEASPSETLTLTTSMSVTMSSIPSRTHSALIGTATTSTSDDQTVTSSLRLSLSPTYTFGTVSLLVSHSLSLTPTLKSPTPMLKDLTSSHSASSDDSATLLSMTLTSTVTDDDSRSRTFTITPTKQTPSPTQTLLLTMDVTNSVTFMVTDTARLLPTRSTSQTATRSITLWLSETRTVTQHPRSHTISHSPTGTESITRNRMMTDTNSTTEVITTTRTITTTNTETSSASMITPSRVTRNLSTQTLGQSLTGQLTPDASMTRSATETLSGDGWSRSSSPSTSLTDTLSETPSATAEPTLSLTKRGTHNTFALSSSQGSTSASEVITDALTESLTLRWSPTHTGTSDVTMTETPSTSIVHSASVTSSRSLLATPSHTRSRSVQSFTSASARIVAPTVTVVRDNVVVAFVRVPLTFSASRDIVYIVLHNDTSRETATSNDCARKVANASLASTSRMFQFVSANATSNGTNVTVYYQGSSAVRGRYDVCHYSASRSQWTWWDIQLNLQVKVRPAAYLLPRGRIGVNNSLRLTLGVYGASPQDHIVLLLRSAAFAAGMTLTSAYCPVTAPFVPGSSSSLPSSVIALLASNVVMTNVTLAATGSVLTAGDYVLCYFGFPFTAYRVALPLLRIAGAVESLTSTTLGGTVTAFSTFRITISGFGLSTLDPFLVANGTACDAARVPAFLTPRRIVSTVPTATSTVAFLTSVVSDIHVDYPIDVATICAKSNMSTYYQPLRTIRVTDNTPVAIQPNMSNSAGQPLEFAQGATIEFRDVVPAVNGTLTQLSGYDTLVLCLGNHTTCSCGQDTATPRQFFTPAYSSRWSQTTWVLRAASLQNPAVSSLTEVWSLCYLTNSSRSWRVAPLQLLVLRRYINEPQVIPATSVQSTLVMSLRSFNITTANALVRLMPSGTSTLGCPTTSAVTSSVASIVVRNVSGDAQVVVVPQLVQPLELCVVDTVTNVTFVSSTIVVVPTAPSLFTPTRFVVNASTDVLFLPNDNTVFNFVTTPATVALCPNNPATVNIRMFVDAVINASALRLRFTNITAATLTITGSALCFFDPRNGTYIPIPQGGNTFAITAQVSAVSFPSILANELRNVARVVASTTAVPTTSASYVTVTVQGISLYQGDLSLLSCSSSPSIVFTHVQTTKTVSSQLYDIVTQVWRVHATVSGSSALCASFGASNAVALFEGNAASSTTPLLVVFDSLMLTAQQLPAIPQAALIDHDNAYWVVAPTANDSNSIFSALRVVQYLSTLDDQCTNPVSANLALSSTAAESASGTAVWRFTAATIAFARGNVTLCYQSRSSKWYAYQDGALQAFFMQAVVLPSTTTFTDVASSLASQAFATCPASIAFSGYQLDATRDSFYYYYSATANPIISTEVCPSTGTALTVSTVARDTTDILRLVNVTATISASRIGNIVVCVRLGDTSRSSPAVNPTILAVLPITNPLNVTLSGRGVAFTSNQTLIALKCISSAVLAALSVVRYNYSVRFEGSAAWMPLESPLSTSSLRLTFSPQVPFIVRYTAFLQATGAVLMTIDSDTYLSMSPTPASQSLASQLTYCSTFNSSSTGLTASSTDRLALATYVILMINFAATNCGPLILDGTVPTSRSAVAAASVVQALIAQDATLVWDGAYLYPLIAATYVSVMSTDGSTSTGISVTAVTSAFASLLAATDPLQDILRGANATDVVRSNLNLLNSIANFVFSSSSSSDASSAVALAPAVVRRLFVVSGITCNVTAAPGSSTSFTAGGLALTTERPLTRSTPASMAVGSNTNVFVSRASTPSNSAGDGCVTSVTAPNFIPAGTTSTSARMHSALATSGFLNTAFNITTVIVFSDAPINNAAITLNNMNYARVDTLQPYRFFDANRSSTELLSTAGGIWDALPQSSSPYVYVPATGSLFVNVTSTPSTAAHYFVFSGVAEGIFPDYILLKRETAMRDVATSLYWILLSVLLAHIAVFIGGAVYDRFTAAKRYRETSDLLFGSPSPTPRWHQVHRYACLFAHNPISMTPKEYLQVRFSNSGGGGVPPDPSSAALQVLTMHPLALLSTPAKVNSIAMYCYCLLLVTAFVNRDNVARQIPFLWDDCVLMGGTAAVIARPFATWTRIAQTRLAQDMPAVVASTLSIVVAIIAGGASSLSTEAVMVSMIVIGVATYSGLVLLLHHRGAGPAAMVISAKEDQRRRKKAAVKAARALRDTNKVTVRSLKWSKSWSLHHLIEVPTIVHIVGLVLLFAAWLLCVVLIFFVPYFANKYPVFEYQPSKSTQTSSSSFAYFGRGDPYASTPDAFTPDSSIAWKTFVVALALDVMFVEFLCTGALVAFMQSVVWWRISRFIGPTTGEKLAKMGSMAMTAGSPGRAEPPTSGHAPDDENLEEVEGDDFHFIDVFSGSPVYEDAEEYTADNTSKQSSSKTPNQKYAASGTATPSWSAQKSFRGAGGATPVPRQQHQQHAKTVFYANAAGQGLVEEVTDEGGWDEDMFASLDEYPATAPPAAKRAISATPVHRHHSSAVSEASPADSMFAEVDGSAFGTEVTSEAGSDDVGVVNAVQATKLVPPTSRHSVGIGRAFRPPPSAQVGPDAAVQPNHNPFGSRDAWNPPSSPRSSRRRNDKFHLGKVEHPGELLEDPWALEEAASTQSN